MVGDHFGFGIGRGAFVSVYPQYKTSPLQLTFAFPENLVAQFFAEWGIIIGLAALVGLVWAVLARFETTDPLSIGALAGVSAVLVQNFVDFSLELAGMAIPVAVVLGATSEAIGRGHDLRRFGPALLAVPAVILAATLGLAFTGGDLDLDLKALARHVEARPDSVPDDVEPTWRRHPANPLISAQVAYLYETAEPPDLTRALKAANRTLYLAPTYADAHLLTGRILLRQGYRSQGLLSIRQAWRIADNRPDLIRHAVALCRDAGEVWQTVPRADEVFDRPDGRALALAARVLGAAGRTPTAVELLSRPYDDSAASSVELDALIAARTRFGLHDLTLSALQYRRAMDGQSVDLLLAEVRVLLRLDRVDDARNALDAHKGRLTKRGLRLAFDVALASGDLGRAREALETLRQRTAGGFEEDQVMMAVRLHLAEKKPHAALDALNDGLGEYPGSVSMRLQRARLLLKIGRPRRAKTDVRLALRRAPDDPQARALGLKLGIIDGTGKIVGESLLDR